MTKKGRDRRSSILRAAKDACFSPQPATASQYARSLIEASLDPFVTISPEGKITDVNEATIRVTGAAREQLIGADFSDYFTEAEKAREGYQRVFEKGFVTDYPLTIRHSDGRLTDVLYNASVYRDADGHIIGVFAAARDVTESKRAMREFAETKNFLDNILQSSTKYSIIGKDLHYRILSWNEGARRNYGYTAEEIMGQDSSILHAPEDVASGAVARLLKTAYEEGLAESEFVRVRKGGARFVASVVVTRRDDSAGNPIGYLLMSTDIMEKKQAEEKLRSASQYARSLIEASLDPFVTISPEGKITDVNEATIRVTGAAREQLIGADFSDYFTEPEKAREGYRQVFEKGFVTDYPLTLRHRDGRLMDVLYNASVYKDTRGNVLGVFAAARDVTAQRQASQYARSLIEASLDPFVTISPGGKITDVNEATIRVTGAAREQLIGADFSDYFTEPEKAREGYQQVFQQGFVTDYPLTLRHRDGRLMDVLYNASVYKDTRGNVLGVFAAARDVTAQRQASQYARSLIEASLDPFVTISPKGKITDVNEATIRATGAAREQLIDADFSDYFTEPEKAREGYRHVFEKGFVTDYPLTLRHRDGRLMDVLYNASVYKDIRGNVLGVFAAARDVTAKKRIEEELAHRARQLQRLTLELSQAEEQERRRIAVILHEDLQQQIAGAKFHLSLVGGRTQDDRLRAEVDEVDAMLREAVETSRSLSRDLSPAVAHMNDLGEVLQWLALRVRGQQGLSVDVAVFGDTMLQSEALAMFLFRAAQEMLFNVIKHAHVREAAIRVRKVGRYVCLRVSDQGCGFDPEELKETPGIGLFSIRERTELLGGRMKVRSARGKGSKFSIMVPDRQKVQNGEKTRQDAAYASAPVSTPSSSAALRILLVDDHNIVRKGLAAMLRGASGVELVGEAPDGREAIRMAVDLQPDVVIMDVYMPLMRGDEATRQIKKYLPKTRVIALSMYDEADKKEGMFQAGAEDYILKTVSAEELLGAIRGRRSGDGIGPQNRACSG